VQGPVDLLGRSGQIGWSSAADAALLATSIIVAISIVSTRIADSWRPDGIPSRGALECLHELFAIIAKTTGDFYAGQHRHTSRQPFIWERTFCSRTRSKRCKRVRQPAPK
jgi:hypothetical protein